MLKSTLAILATIATSSFASAAQYPMHRAYSCQTEQGQRVTLSLPTPNELQVFSEGLKPLVLNQEQGPANNAGYEVFTGIGGCTQEVKPGFANCFAIIRYEAELSPELQRGEFTGKAEVLGNEYVCRLNMM